MSMKHFRVHKHTLPTSHIREYPRATANDQEDVLHLAIKQYTPKDQRVEDDGDVTIIAAHANGFPKELYEPLWDDLYERLKAKHIKIRSIWIADVSHQGESGVLNEAKMGNDPSWMDHPRDLFLMVNHFRKHMKRPLIGIGHSMGGNHLINLSLMHPRLFATLILMDPVVQSAQSEGNVGPAKASTIRRDKWPSKNAARAAFKKSKFYQAWDSRVLETWVEHGLRETPTLIYPDIVNTSRTLPTVSAEPTSASIQPDRDAEVEVTLKTTKHQEVFTFQRPAFPTPEYPEPLTRPNPMTHADLDLTTAPNSYFYRPEPLSIFNRLPHVRPSVFYVFGEHSPFSAPGLREEKVELTGSGVGGSGGLKNGRVAETLMKGTGHLIPMEDVGGSATAISDWIEPELQLWRSIDEVERKEWAAVPMVQKTQMSDEFKNTMLNGWKNGNQGKPQEPRQPKL